MYFLKSIISASYRVSGTVMIVSGLGIIILAFMNSPLQLQIVLGFIGLGFIVLGLVQLKRLQDEKRDKERFDEIMAKLDEIQKELKKEEQSKGSGIAIADVITSGLKYYAEHMTKQNKEE
ncbi:hypothetical protein ACFLXF_02485 [Chloroflexota bacterium]